MYSTDCIPRAVMPQIDAADIPGLIEFFRAQGFPVQEWEHTMWRTLRMIQCPHETHPATLTPELRRKPIIVASQNKIIDGNGRYLAYREAGIDLFPLILIDRPFSHVALTMMQYPKAYTLFGGSQPCRL